MTIETIGYTELNSKINRLIHTKCKKFELVFITPSRIEHGLVTQYIIGYWLIK